ncbi:MAG: ABC transporter ATP-binding protein [Actinomycetota bacterium]
MTPVQVGEVRLRGVSRRYRVLHERNHTLKETLLRRRRTVATDHWVLRDVDLDVPPGQALGIIGRNGIGKSTLLKLVAGVIPPQAGTVEVGGVVASMLELGAGFHPDFSGVENVVLQGALHGVEERVIRARMDDIVAFAELDDYIDMPVKTYSSGMFMRLGFSVAVHIEADVMLLDEVLAVGDAAFQRKCLGRIHEFRDRGGTLLFVSHDADTVTRVCDRAILLNEGHVVADGTPAEVLAEYDVHLAREASRRTVKEEHDRRLGETSGVPGTGRVEITGVRLLGRDGETDRFASGDELAVELDLEPRETVHRPLVGIEFHTMDSIQLYGTNNRMDGVAIDELSAPTTIRFRIPRLPLHQGRFQLSAVACSRDESEIYHLLRFCREFTVAPRGPGVGPVAVDAEWDVEVAREPATP